MSIRWRSGQHEGSILQQLMIEYSKRGSRVFRNNVGTLKTEGGRYLQYGVGHPGGSDLIGWTRIPITAEMTGKVLAVFTAIEVKAGRTRTTPEQQAFVESVRRAGGIGVVAHSFADGIDQLTFPSQVIL